MKTIAIIPARGGSKRIEHKNVKEFAGLPIIAYSIRAALAAGCFDEVMVSTDDEEIASVARSFGASVPFMRSAATSDDFATTADVIREVLARYRESGREFDALACIYATAPFVTARRLEDAFSILANGCAQAAFTCVEYSYPVQRCLVVDDDGRIGMLHPEYANSRSQDLRKTYHDAGQFYFTTVAAFEACGSLWGPDTRPIILPETEVQDLDTPVDWRLAELKFSMLSFPERFEAGGYSFVAYPALDPETSGLLLSGRNEPEVRRWMVNTGEISTANHETFVRSLVSRRDKQYYAVFDNEGNLVGSVNMDRTGPDTMERGIWMFADARGKGHAKRLLRALYGYFAGRDGVKCIETRVKDGNEASLALERSLGASEQSAEEGYHYFHTIL